MVLRGLPSLSKSAWERSTTPTIEAVGSSAGLVAVLVSRIDLGKITNRYRFG